MTSLILIALLTVNPIAACLLDLDNNYISVDLQSFLVDKTVDTNFIEPLILENHMLSRQPENIIKFGSMHPKIFEELYKISASSIFNSFEKTSIFY